MKDVIIVCAGNHAREIHAHIKRANRIAEEWGEERPYNLLGFLSDVPGALEGTGVEEPVLGTIVDRRPMDHEWHIMGTAGPEGKAKLAPMLKERGCRFTTFVAPHSIVADDLEMGEGCVIQAYRIDSGVEPGDFVSVNSSFLMSGARIGSYSTTTGFSVVENAAVGERVYVGGPRGSVRRCERRRRREAEHREHSAA